MKINTTLVIIKSYYSKIDKKKKEDIIEFGTNFEIVFFLYWKIIFISIWKQKTS